MNKWKKKEKQYIYKYFISTLKTKLQIHNLHCNFWREGKVAFMINAIKLNDRSKKK